MTHLLPSRFVPRARVAGMSLMEILIAMAIGLIGIVVITQTYLVNESYKRSTTSAGGAQTNGALALFTIERDARMGGWGFAWSSVLGCGGLRWHYNGDYSNPPGGGLPLLQPVPVVIADGGAGPDTITVMYGTGTERVIPATLSKTMASADAELEVDNSQGFSNNPGDLILVAQGATCAMVQVTGVTGGTLQHVAGVNAPYNPGGGSTLPAFAVNSLVFNLGRPVVNTYSINNSALQVASLFTSTSSTVVPNYTPGANTIVDNIVDLQAQYGKDNGVNNGTVAGAVFVANDGIVDSYDNVTPANSTEWQQVLSIRMGVLARSEHYVRPDTAGGPCTATTAAPTWANGQAFPAPGDFTDPANQARCYGYRVFETVVPLRNMIWRQG
ncbi:MAG: PilW family protein [Betaproteobacteria bacterium]|nr:PilW family protein [Betaproteobacteria bacterium]